MATYEVRLKDGVVWIDPKTMRPHPEMRFVKDTEPGFAAQKFKCFPKPVDETQPLTELPEKEAKGGLPSKKRPVRAEQLEKR